MKLRKSWYLTVLAMITVGRFVQISSAASDLPSNQQVIAFLTQSIDWYRHCAIEGQIATDPVDLVFLEGNRPSAAQILQLSFDFARADAQISASPQANSRTGSTATGSAELAHFVQLEDKTELQRRQASEEIEVIGKRLKTAHGADRRELQAALETTQSRLDVLQTGLITLRQSIEFVQAFTSRETGDLASSIEDLARTVPTVTSPTTVTSQPQTAPATLPTKPSDSGILTLSSEVSALGKKLRILDDEIRRTENLRQVSDSMRSPLVASINNRLPAVYENALQASDLAELQQQKTRLDELGASLKTLSPAIMALDKQRLVLAAYASHLKSWRAAVSAEDEKTWKSLVSRLLRAVVVIGALMIIGAVARGGTRRHMRDTDRRHIVLVIQRIILWSAMVTVTAFAFASDVTSLATFFGLLAAGVAVALQSVILSAFGYFVLVGRRGIRIGDRVQISGVTGDVTDIGWLQFQLREIDIRTQQSTGNVVTFSNSFVLASPATGLSKFNRNDLKSAQFEVASKASQS